MSTSSPYANPLARELKKLVCEPAGREVGGREREEGSRRRAARSARVAHSGQPSGPIEARRII
jgi:hypothetical protein